MKISISNARKASKLFAEIELLEKSLLVLEKNRTDAVYKTLVSIHVNPPIHLDLDIDQIIILSEMLKLKIKNLKNQISELGFHLD